MKPIIKSISFTGEYAEELAFYMKQANKSKYICELIKRDRLDNMPLTKANIIALIDEKLKNLSIQVEPEREDDIDSDTRNSLIGLFGV